jgi:hypothetical protein
MNSGTQVLQQVNPKVALDSCVSLEYCLLTLVFFLIFKVLNYRHSRTSTSNLLKRLNKSCK